MRMAAVKTVSRTVVQKGSRTIEDDGKAKRKLFLEWLLPLLVQVLVAGPL